MRPLIRDEALLRYVSNLDQDVYTIMNLPEEVVAVIFAYVSRSPKSFRENLQALLMDEEIALPADAAPLQADVFASASEKAKRFHERWVVGYGHSSVAEHGVVHIGIENVSRLASAELELSNPFLSFTEYSQRYQRPKRDRFVVPEEIQAWPVLAERFEGVQHLSFDAYERIEEGLFTHLARFHPPKADEDDERYRQRIGRMGFEDARYVLSLAVTTSLGMTANGRALRDALVQLLADSRAEVRSLARALERQAVRVLPTLLRHVEPAPSRPAPSAKGPKTPRGSEDAVVLADYTGRGTPDPKAVAQDRMLMLRGQAWDPGEDSKGVDKAYREAFTVGSPHDPLPSEAEHVSYTFRLMVSEANWHQLLRHSRRIAFTAAPPSVTLGYVVPPLVREAGLEPIYRATIGAAEGLYRDVVELSPTAAHYIVTNAHRRAVTATLSLRELAHLRRVRGQENVQWDIRSTVEGMVRAVETVHPGLLGPLAGQP